MRAGHDWGCQLLVGNGDVRHTPDKVCPHPACPSFRSKDKLSTESNIIYGGQRHVCAGGKFLHST